MQRFIQEKPSEITRLTRLLHRYVGRRLVRGDLWKSRKIC